MLKIKYARGDATAPPHGGNRIIVHICNDIGGWGKGFVAALSKRWPYPELCYRHYAKSFTDVDEFMELGAVQLVLVEKDLIVANLIGQHHVRTKNGVQPIRYGAIRQGFNKIAAVASDLKASVHMPRIGTGYAGGSWADVERIIISELSERDIPVTVYDL
jgi:O-acetyl-ADP-ribose deacetylase (regulator of RNase III)